MEQARCSLALAWSLHLDEQLDAAEEAASHAIGLHSEKGEQYQVCRCHHVLGGIYYSKGMTEKAINHFEATLEIGCPCNWLFWVHFSLTKLLFNEGRFDDAHVHVERAKPHMVNNTRPLAWAVQLQARLRYKQRRFEEAKSEALRAVDVFEKLGAAKDVECTRQLLQEIDEEAGKLVTQ